MAFPISESERIVGCLIGLAVGDATGTTVEFMPPGSFPPVQDMKGGGKFNLSEGQWTDDTSMMLCLAESLIECQGFNPIDQCKRYCKWYEEGHLSCTGECFDIGMTVRNAINQFKRSNETQSFPGSTSPRAAGNGCLMRLCPVPLVYRHDPVIGLELSALSAKVTHGPIEATDACKYFAGLLIGCLKGVEKKVLLSSMYCPVPGYWSTNTMAPKVKDIACGSYKTKSLHDIKGTGYVIDTLEAVLWAFYNDSNSFKEGCLKAVNLGDDADTVGAIYGQLAGAYYGINGIPLEWREKIAFNSLITLFARELEQMSPLPYVPDQEWPSLVDPSKLSEEYQIVKLQLYDQLETASHSTAYRRSSPCPRQYKSLIEFDEDVEKMKQNSREFIRLASEKQYNTKIMKDFEKLWNEYRSKLQTRLSRSH